MKSIFLIILCSLLLAPAAFGSGQLDLSLAPAASNPSNPRMGDHLTFRSVITNQGSDPVQGLVAWIGLVRVDPGKERPVDLEDWSAQKAVTRGILGSDESLITEWPMRLIQSGNYRVVISATERNSAALVTSPFASFHSAPKPVVEAKRIIPVAVVLPLLIACLALGRFVYDRRYARHNSMGA